MGEGCFFRSAGGVSVSGMEVGVGEKKKGVPRPQRAVNPNVLSRSENQMTFNTIVIDDSGPSKSSGAET